MGGFDQKNHTGSSVFNMQASRSKKTEMFLFSIFCHHTFWLHWESGRKKEALAPFIC